MTMRRIILTASAALLAAPGTARPQPLPHYALRVELDPAAHALRVRGSLSGLGDSLRTIFLNQSFRVQRLAVDGRAVKAVFDRAAAPPPYVSVARPLVLGRAASRLDFAYSGNIADTIDDVNMLGPDLVELASYSGWFPFAPELTRFTYDLTVILPAGYMLTGAGRLADDTPRGGRRTVRLTSTVPAFDVPIVASPTFRRWTLAAGTSQLEIYGPAHDAALARRTLGELAAAFDTLTTWFGAAAGSGMLRLVYSPRGGWGYSRLPLIVVSDRTKDAMLRAPLGEARNFEGNAHELAHFWWSVADVGTADDWLNEGLAEYSAFALAGKRYGAAFADTLLAGYRRDAARAHGSILETVSSTPDRYANRYEKPALLLDHLARSARPRDMHRLLGQFYARWRGTRRATTRDFVALARTVLGHDAAATLDNCLHRADWPPACGG
jgi:hypothetical protein